MSVEELKKRIVPIAKEYGVGKVALFGSVAKGLFKEDSDIDILIERGELRGMFSFGSFIKKLEDSLETHIDLITYKSIENSLLKNSILSSEVVIYKQQGVINK